MKQHCLFTLTTLLLLALVSCSKVHNLPAPSNIDLSNKPLTEVKTILYGKWQLHYLRGGFCGVCEYPRYDEYYTFSPADHIKWTIDKQVWADTTITWLQQEWQSKQINVMEYYAIDDNLHHLSPDRIYHDTLVMFEPGYDGMSYYLTKVKQ